MELQRIYLDYAATTPVDQRVLETMLPYFSEHYGNPSSIHTFGQEAESAMENARETVAQILSCQPKEIIFTSCGSESDNLALRGAAFAARQIRSANHLLVIFGVSDDGCQVARPAVRLIITFRVRTPCQVG